MENEQQEGTIPPAAPNPWAVPDAPAMEGAGAPLAPPAPPAPPVAPAAPETPPAPPAPPVDAAPPAPSVAEPIPDPQADPDNVTVTVPKAFNLRLDVGQEIVVQSGIQQMSRAAAEHWYSKANGVKIYTPRN